MFSKQTKASAKRGNFDVLKKENIVHLMKIDKLLGFHPESLSHEIHPGNLIWSDDWPQGQPCRSTTLGWDYHENN